MLKNSILTFILALTINLLVLFIFGVRGNIDSFLINLSTILIYAVLLSLLMAYSVFRKAKLTKLSLVISNALALLYLVVYYFIFTPTWSNSIGLIGYIYIATIGIVTSLLVLIFKTFREKLK
jgi:peptidoglycan/LPS O-acetylase OafA/YrhL